MTIQISFEAGSFGAHLPAMFVRVVPFGLKVTSGVLGGSLLVISVGSTNPCTHADGASIAWICTVPQILKIVRLPAHSWTIWCPLS